MYSITGHLKEIVQQLTNALLKLFEEYMQRHDHYSGEKLRAVFDNWLNFSFKSLEYSKGDSEERRRIEEIFCRETAYAIIGRVLFIRISEDKGVIEPRISGPGLAKFLEWHKRWDEDAYLIAISQTRRIMERYYSYLYELNAFFDWWELESAVKGTLKKDDMIAQLRLERELNASFKDMLARLNRFDFKEVDRDVLKDVYQTLLPPEERKRLGEFYTPDAVIRYILDGAGCTEENPIEDKTFLDPACGSGGFLVETSRRLMRRYERKGLNLEDPDVARVVLKGIKENIHGLDIHPFACFISKMNMLFQTLDLHESIRRSYPNDPVLDMGFNIFRTDSLLIDRIAGTLEAFAERNKSMEVALREAEKAEEAKKKKFHFVAGNPPYVRVDNIPQQLRKTYKKSFSDILAGKWDIYIPFIYRGLEWLEEGGVFGYIVSNKFFLLEYGLPLRKYILDDYVIEQIVDLSGVEVFAESLPSPSIVIIHKGRT